MDNDDKKNQKVEIHHVVETRPAPFVQINPQEPANEADVETRNLLIIIIVLIILGSIIYWGNQTNWFNWFGQPVPMPALSPPPAMTPLPAPIPSPSPVPPAAPIPRPPLVPPPGT